MVRSFPSGIEKGYRTLHYYYLVPGNIHLQNFLPLKNATHSSWVIAFSYFYSKTFHSILDMKTMKQITLLIKIVFLSSILFLSGIKAWSQVLTSTEIDTLVEKTLKAFNVPGIAVAVIKDGEIVHSKGYGVRSLDTKQKVDENTLFCIASNSKAFTTAALGMLIDENKLHWIDKVTDYIPEFKMYNPYATEEFTITDLLTHRSGLGLGAGDLMIFPDGSNFTKADIIHNLRYLKPVSSFRTKYDYDNLLYIVAGEVVVCVSGMSWEDFVETRIMKPLGMTQSAASYNRLKDKSNVIDPHAEIDGKVKVIERDMLDAGNAAGGIYSNINDLSKWVLMHLRDGKYGDSLQKQLFSSAVHNDMWSPQTIIPVRGKSPYNTHFSSYGLGWGISDVKGFKQLTHTGGLAGIVTQITLIPELNLGIIVLTNQQVGEAFSAITNTIKDGYLGIEHSDRIKQYHDQVVKNREEADKITNAVWSEIESQKKKTAVKPDFSIVEGTYSDSWFGKIVIGMKDGKPWFTSLRSPKLNGEMFYYKADTYVVKWNYRSMEADAFAIFRFDEKGKAAGLTMKAISPLTDFSFDFQDLDFEAFKK